MQQDEEIVITQDDLYTITWETNFGEQLATRGNEPIPTSLPNGERPTTTKANTNDPSKNEADYIITTHCPNDVNVAAHSRDKRNESDISNTNETTEALEMKTLVGRIRLKDRKTMQIFRKEILLTKTMHKSLQKEGMILSCPKHPKMMQNIKI